MSDTSKAPKTSRPLVLAAPSGTGKTTIARRLVDENEDFVFSTSATTRAPRPEETDGLDYSFVTAERFEKMTAAGEFAEWAEVHGNMYGTPTANLEAASERGETVVMDIDVQGAAQIQATMPDVTLVFVLPPDAPTMLDRITKRGTESEEEVVRRLRSALEELARVYEFERVVVNDELEVAVAEVKAMALGEAAGRRPMDEARRIDTLRRDLAEELRTRARKLQDAESAHGTG